MRTKTGMHVDHENRFRGSQMCAQPSAKNTGTRLQLGTAIKQSAGIVMLAMGDGLFYAINAMAQSVHGQPGNKPVTCRQGRRIEQLIKPAV